MRSVLLGMCLIAVVGCKRQTLQEQLVGVWQGEFANQIVTLQLRSDLTYTASMPTGMDGTWSVSENKVHLTIEKFMGLDIKDAIARAKKDNPENLPWLEQPGVIDINDARTMLRMNPPAGVKSDTKIILEKKSEE
ncbi:MAG: hypothetical protein ABL962_13940 [Fimbriimonadaceae bacterium]